MISGLLVLSIAAGVIWADLERTIPDAFVLLWLVAVAAVSVRLVSAIRLDARKPVLCVVGLCCAAGLALFAGFDRLDATLSQAHLDAERALRSGRDAIRLVDARVRARRSGSWGDEIELVSVRAVDAAGPMPETLLLRLGEAVKGQPLATPSRSDRLLWPGAWVRLGVVPAPLRMARNPGTHDREHALRRRGWAARARLVKPDWVLSLSDPSFDWQGALNRIERVRAGWRHRVGARLGEVSGSGSLVRALGLGDRSGIQQETRTAFRRLGLSHLLAVSGLHVGFVAGLAGWLFVRIHGWLGRGRRIELPFDWALAVACCAAALYAWVTGGSISVERAALLFGLFAVCRLCMRSIDPGVALAWVAAGMLLMDPGALFDVGAQLSFGACGALIMSGIWGRRAPLDGLADRDPRLLERAAKAVGVTFRASLAVSLGTAPMLAHHGLALTILSPLVNVLAIPWTGFFVLPTALLAVVLAEIVPDAFLAVMTVPANALEMSVVWAAAYLPEASARALMSWPMLVGASGLALFRIRAGHWKGALLVWVGIALAGARPISSGPLVLAAPQAIFFDVGQGDATLVQGRRASLLIDAGPGPPDGTGGRGLVRGLRAIGMRSIDVLAVTHGDLDHRAGASRVLKAFRVGELWLPVSGTKDAPLIRLARIAMEHETRVRWLGVGAQGTDRGDLEIDVLWPASSSASASPAARNEDSMVLRVVVDGTVVLFTADIGAESEAALTARFGPELEADLLKVAHHGSRHSSSASFLDAVAPQIAVVSAPCNPTRGLPNAEALGRLRHSGASLWWTGRDGAVVASFDRPGNVVVRSWGRARECVSRP